MPVAKFELLFRLIAPPVMVAPVVPVSNPAEVIVPVPEVEMLPLVVTASPAVVGDSTVPVLFQYPRLPVSGAVEVNVLVPLVYTPELGVKPLTVSPANVGEDVVLILCGVESVILPFPLATITWSAVPVSVALVRVFPVVLPIRISPLI
jgi:hypothetical protein